MWRRQREDHMSNKIGPAIEQTHEVKAIYDKFSATKPIKWLTDCDVALTQAGIYKPHIVMAYFSGSDWCQPCQHLHDEVFENATFLTWFNIRYLVPLLVDFPQYTPQDPDTKQQNLQLQQQYQVFAFPSVLAIKADGSEIDRLVGYAAGYGPSKWIKDFTAIAGIK
jgi:hypothetical protein